MVVGTSGNVIVDLDGVVYLDDVPVPGAGEALSALRAGGFSLCFVTNASTKTAATVAGRIASITGFPAVEEEVLTSGMAAAALLAPGAYRCLVVGEQGLVDTLTASGLVVVDDWREADAVVVGLDRAVTYQRLRDATLAVRDGARFVATNADPSFPTPTGLWPGAGSLVSAIATASGRSAEVTGKPEPPLRELLRTRLGPGPTWVVGDRPETDLAMGKAEGWSTALVLTGVIADPAEVPDRWAPDVVVESIAALPSVLTGSAEG